MSFQPKYSPDQRVDLNLVPLIDVLFNILIFFAVSTTFAGVSGIKVNLPKATSKEVAEEKADLRLMIHSDGGIFLDKESLDENALGREFAAAHERNPDTVVIIQADENVSHGRVVRIMDLARRRNLSRLMIATELADESAPEKKSKPSLNDP